MDYTIEQLNNNLKLLIDMCHREELDIEWVITVETLNNVWSMIADVLDKLMEAD